MDPFFGLGVFACLLLVLLIGVLLLRRSGGDRQSQTLVSALEGLVRNQNTLEGRLQALSEAQANSHSTLQRTLEERLETVSIRMGQSLTETAQKTAESLGNLQQRLTTIDEAQKNITELSTQVVGLQDVLANKQLRGAFGQIQMEDIVRNGLPPNAYSFQYKLGNNMRPDCMLVLPNPPGAMCVDAKFPAEGFHVYMAAREPEEKIRAARQVRTDMRKHIADIGSKYILAGETADCALMFLPSESIYAELHTSFEDVLQDSYKARVFIVSPTTFMATLNTMRAILRDAEMRKQAGLIQEHVRRMAEDVHRLGDRVEKLRSHFGQAGKDIDDIATSARKITNRADKIDRVELEDDETTELPNPVDLEAHSEDAEETGVLALSSWKKQVSAP